MALSEQEKQRIDQLLGPQPGWESFAAQRHGPASQARREEGVGTFVPWQANDRLALRVYRRVSDGATVGRAWFGAGAMGPPASAHGGAQASVLDHALGAAVWMAGHPSQTASYTHEYRRRLPLGRAIDVVTRIDSVEGRKVRASGWLIEPGSADESTLDDARVFSQASALFIKFSAEDLKRFSSGA